MELKQDPFEILRNFGRSVDSLILVGTPLILLVIIALVMTIFVLKRRKKEEAIIEESSHEKWGGEATENKILPQPEATPEFAPASEIAPELASEEKPPEEEPEDVKEIKNLDQKGWLSKLKQGLSKTRDSWTGSLSSLFSGGAKIDDDTLEKLHEILYRADVGVKVADKLVEKVKTTLKGQDSVSWDTVREVLQKEISEIVKATDKPINQPQSGPLVILVVGVNGVGKTTSIGKLSAHFLAQDKSVLLCAADTYRAAAIDQLKVWGERTGVNVVAHKQGSDPAAVAYDAVKAAIARKIDVLLIDTAGRLHSKEDLMAELAKIKRVMGKDLPDAPHEVWLVVDATTGQNANMQVKAFNEVVDLSGLIVTKLDGTAKGGVIIGITDQYQLPIRYIGVGEKAADLRPFKAEEFAETLLS